MKISISKFFPLSLVAFLLAINFVWSNFLHAEHRYTGTTSAFVSYANAAKNSDLSKSPMIYMGFDDNHHYIPFTVDTGSVGIVVSSHHFKPSPNAKNLGPGHQYYSSSGVIEKGTWWTATQKIYDAHGRLIATATVPVLQVTSIECAENARKCHTNDHPKGVAMMGIGFARSGKQQPHGTPDYNVLLNLKNIVQNGVLKPLPKDWCNGYVVTPNGIELGLTPHNTANAGFIKLMSKTLTPPSSVPEWTATPGTVSVNGVSGTGHILMDTGVTTSYLTPPSDAKLGPLVACPHTGKIECAPKGTVIDVYFPDKHNPIAYYTFTIGDESNHMQPKSVHVVTKKPDIFFNTGMHILNGMNFIYDNTNGYIGFIWNGRSNNRVGYVKQTN